MLWEEMLLILKAKQERQYPEMICYPDKGGRIIKKRKSWRISQMTLGRKARGVNLAKKT